MHILIGLIAAAALLYFWLVGHWFARWLMFIVLAVAFAAAGAGFVGGEPPGSLILVALGAGAGWFASGCPTYYWRRQERRYHDALGRVQRTV